MSANYTLVRSASKTGGNTLTIGEANPLQTPFTLTAAEAAWAKNVDFNFEQPNLPVTSGSYSVQDTNTVNNAITNRETAVTILYIAGAAVAFIVLIKILKHLHIL